MGSSPPAQGAPCHQGRSPMNHEARNTPQELTFLCVREYVYVRVCVHVYVVCMWVYGRVTTFIKGYK